MGEKKGDREPTGRTGCVVFVVVAALILLVGYAGYLLAL